MPSLNSLRLLRSAVVRAKWLYLTKIWKMDIHPTATFSLSADFDKTFPRASMSAPKAMSRWDP